MIRHKKYDGGQQMPAVFYCVSLNSRCCYTNNRIESLEKFFEAEMCLARRFPRIIIEIYSQFD